jgi:hypothetical protein
MGAFKRFKRQAALGHRWDKLGLRSPGVVPGLTSTGVPYRLGFALGTAGLTFTDRYQVREVILYPPWLSFAEGPGGRAIGPAPVSRPDRNRDDDDDDSDRDD